METPAPDQALAEVIAGPEKFLTPKERDALHLAERRNPPYSQLSTHLKMKLFQLFLQGIDCAEIARINQGVALGQILLARVDERWDEKRQDHVEKLLHETQMRLQQTMVEGFDFVSLALAAVHKQEGDKIKKYLQTGDPKDLGDFGVSSWSAYSQVLNILQRLTGAPQAPPQKHEHVHTHEHTAVPAANRGMKHEEAKNVIEGVLLNRRKA